ncbi:hypothetical protein CAEBREN_31982 [Caenorhabditis brenneri]|uniref:ISXO2-like transposase domain-containing protein n=1 Tax=Caenorhabditis brenneri TaxID=135651 RepID=G0NFB0_CAEBE|nr:hypothetical protein CAEBREN_31982 [Caenorhabditis brenneri]
MFQVTRRDARTLLPIIERHVAPGTTIITDGWSAYREINKMSKGFKHHVINHNLHFVDPRNKKIHTQGIESSWGALKRSLKSRYGINDYMLKGHLFNYIFRRYNKREKLLNRLIIEMRHYDRSSHSLVPDDFDEMFPVENERDGDEDEDSDMTVEDVTEESDDEEPDTLEDDSALNEAVENHSDISSSLSFPDADKELHTLHESDDDDYEEQNNSNDNTDVEEDSDDHEKFGSPLSSLLDSSKTQFVQPRLSRYGHRRESILQPDEPSGSGLIGTNRNLHYEDELDLSNESTRKSESKLKKKKSGRQQSNHNDYEEQNNSNDGTGVEEDSDNAEKFSSSSSSSPDSSGSEYVQPRSSRYGHRRERVLRPDEPSGSGLIGTNGNLRFADEEDSSGEFRRTTKSKKNKKVHQLEQHRHSPSGKIKLSSPTSFSSEKVPLLQGTSLASKRRTMRGRGRKEGMAFSLDVRQRHFEKEKRQQTKKVTRGRGSRGGKIGDRLKKEREQHAEIDHLLSPDKELTREDRHHGTPLVAKSGMTLRSRPSTTTTERGRKRGRPLKKRRNN